MKRQIIFILSLFITGAAMAQESLFKFTPTGESTASVAAASRDISGVVTVPAKTIINGKEYTVTSVADDGFERCAQLEEVVLPEGIWELCNYAFYFSGIKRMTIPASTARIGYGVFTGCQSLETFEVAEGNSYYYDTNGILMGSTNRYVATCIVAVPAKLNIVDFTIPDNVGMIDMMAFSYNKSLKRIVIPSSVTRVNDLAFNMCENLKQVVWNASTTNIAYGCFMGCSALEQFTIPETVKNIESAAFYACPALRTITIRNGNPIGVVNGSFGDEVFENATLYVPTGSAKYYRAANVWKNFKHIEEIHMPGVEVPENHYAALEDNQMILGYYRSENCQSPYDEYGAMDVGTQYAYIGFDKEWMTSLKGNRIRNIRFAIKDTTMLYDVKVYIGSEQLKDDICLQEVKMPKIGWNEVELQTPYLVTGDSIFVGVQFKLREFRNYPFEWVYGGEEGSFYRYGTVGGTFDQKPYQYWDWGKERGYALCLQCLVEGDRLPENVVHYTRLDLDGKYYRRGENITGSLPMRNIGKNPIEKFEMTAYIDGEPFSVRSHYGGYIENNSQLYYSYFDIPLEKTLPAGMKQLTVEVNSINGKPITYSGGDKNSQVFKCYSQSMKRDKILVELFSSMGCGNSYWGFENVGAVKHQFPETTCVLYYRGAPELICENYIDALVTGFPTIYVSRYASPGATSLQENRYGSSETISFFEEALTRPAFASVNISSQYDEKSRQLRVKVNGVRNEDFLPVEGYTHLTVHLVEDGLTITDIYSDESETLDDILRGCMTDIWGDPVEWNSDAYEMNYTMVLPETWNPEKMRIVAFLAKPFLGNNCDEMDVVNCNDAKLGGSSTSNIGESIVDIQHIAPKGIYNLNGQFISNDIRSLSNLPKGIYIVNGKKIAVK